jgi:hypothetical protein
LNEDALPRRAYYSERAGLRSGTAGFTLEEFRGHFLDLHRKHDNEGLFQRWFGYFCVDRGDVAGRAGGNHGLYCLRKLGRPGLWPIYDSIDRLAEDDIFDLVEFLFDHAAEGAGGSYHEHADCGWHYRTFNVEEGRLRFRLEVNELLRHYGPGFELSPRGEVIRLGDEAMAPLMASELPGLDPVNVQQRVASAILKYRRRAASEGDRADAVRDLAGVLEFMHSDIKRVLTNRDDGDLFNLANNFGIRHHNPKQKTHYDQDVWLDWMFYFYLATIHACARLIEKRQHADLAVGEGGSPAGVESSAPQAAEADGHQPEEPS